LKGGWIVLVHGYPSQMAQNFWTAIVSWTTCFLVTIIVSLLTKAHEEASLVGLVHSLTPKLNDVERVFWRRPVFLGGVVIAGALALNLIFR